MAGMERGVASEDLLERRAKGAAVVCGLGLKIARISSVEASEPARRRRIEAVGTVRAEQMLHLGERPDALAPQQHVYDSRAAAPLHQPAVVEAALAGPRVAGGADAQQADAVQRLAEHADRLNHTYQGGVVGPHPAVGEPHLLTGKAERREVRRRRAGRHRHLPHWHPPITL